MTGKTKHGEFLNAGWKIGTVIPPRIGRNTERPLRRDRIISFVLGEREPKKGKSGD